MRAFNQNPGKAAFASLKPLRENITQPCLNKCQVNKGLSQSQYLKLKDASINNLCSLPFNKMDLNVNLVTKNNFMGECVIQNKNDQNCNQSIQFCSLPYLYYSFYPNRNSKCVLNNNAYNRVYYPPNESNL